MAHVPVARRQTMAVIEIDILRASSTLHACIAAGSRGIVLAIKPATGGYDLTPPFGEANDWNYGGEENGLPIPGGIIGNSPLVDPESNVLMGKYLKFFSTNGARALASIYQAGVGGIFLASLANIEITVLDAIRRGFETIWFVCGGFYGSGTLEDTVCAGRGIRALLESGSIAHDRLDDESRIALHAASPYMDDECLVADLRLSQVGLLLRHIGREADLEAVVGRGMGTDLWRRMQATVVVSRTVSGVSMFIAD
jgi:phosphosulfolactate phosphohydrolase-like enzyme